MNEYTRPNRAELFKAPRAVNEQVPLSATDKLLQDQTPSKGFFKKAAEFGSTTTGRILGLTLLTGVAASEVSCTHDLKKYTETPRVLAVENMDDATIKYTVPANAEEAAVRREIANANCPPGFEGTMTYVSGPARWGGGPILVDFLRNCNPDPNAHPAFAQQIQSAATELAKTPGRKEEMRGDTKVITEITLSDDGSVLKNVIEETPQGKGKKPRIVKTEIHYPPPAKPLPPPESIILQARGGESVGSSQTLAAGGVALAATVVQTAGSVAGLHLASQPEDHSVNTTTLEGAQSSSTANPTLKNKTEARSDQTQGQGQQQGQGQEQTSKNKNTNRNTNKNRAGAKVENSNVNSQYENKGGYDNRGGTDKRGSYYNNGTDKRGSNTTIYKNKKGRGY